MSCVDSVLRLLWRMNLRASSSTCDTRYSMSEHRPCKTSSLREVMPTDSATSLILSGFQTDMMNGFCCWEGGGHAQQVLGSDVRIHTQERVSILRCDNFANSVGNIFRNCREIELMEVWCSVTNTCGPRVFTCRFFECSLTNKEVWSNSKTVRENAVAS